VARLMTKPQAETVIRFARMSPPQQSVVELAIDWPINYGFFVFRACSYRKCYPARTPFKSATSKKKEMASRSTGI
jgi:hypothetical protein